MDYLVAGLAMTRPRNLEEFILNIETRHCEAIKFQKKHIFSEVSRSNLSTCLLICDAKDKRHTKGVKKQRLLS